MLRIHPGLKIGSLATLALAVVCAALMLSGCGSSDTSATPAGMPTASRTSPHTAAVGPAVDAKLPFEALAFDSPVKHVKDSNGLEFLQFRYTDNEDKVYECVLPAAMAQGKRSMDAWVGVFNVYKKPKVLAQKKHGDDGKQQLDDLPLISPKPREAPKVESETAKPTIHVPTTPSGPSMSPGPNAPPGPPTMPGAMPNRMPGPPRGG